MLDIKVIQQVDIANITESQLSDMILEKIAQVNPNITVTELNFIPKRKPAGIEVEVTAQIGNNPEPMKEVSTSAPKKATTDLPDDDDVEEETTNISRDGVPPSEMSLIDEALAEEDNEPMEFEEKKETEEPTGQTVEDIFNFSK